jgi:phosphate-selective porin OprO/OprP
VAVRVAELDPNSDKDNDERTEDGVALSYYFNKHNHKLQGDFRNLEDKARKAKDREIRLQYQLIF